MCGKNEGKRIKLKKKKTPEKYHYYIVIILSSRCTVQIIQIGYARTEFDKNTKNISLTDFRSDE